CHRTALSCRLGLRPPGAPLFPYTTLFRSQAGGRVAGGEGIGSRGPGETKIELDRRRIRTRMAQLRRQIKAMEPAREVRRERRLRSEEHTSELQSRENLVCRLLLEKKKAKL